MRKIVVGTCLILLVLALMSATFSYYIYQMVGQSYGSSAQHGVHIPRGSSLARVGHLLAEAGLLRFPYLFRIAQKIEPSDRTLQAGRYLIPQPISPLELLQLLREGKTHRLKLTIREGLDWRETISFLVSGGFGSRRRFRELVTSPQMIQDLDSGADDLEGYLFPETYLLEVTANQEEIIKALLNQARQIWTPERRRRSQQLGMSIREVVTLASLIEKETGSPEERGLVSSVFHNRLRRNMNLACDPTVIYAVKRVKEYDGIIHRSDLEFDSPYNTYLYPGLPPGPIANPGLASIDAALHPAGSSYLYFVSRNDGTHVFSRTYQEHARAVQIYQR